MVVVVGRVTCKYKKEEGQQQPRHRHCGADVPGARANTKKRRRTTTTRHCGVDVSQREPSPGKG